MMGSTKGAPEEPPRTSPEAQGHDSFWSGSEKSSPLRSLVDRLAGDVVMDHVAGLRVLDLGHGAPSIIEWIRHRIVSLEVVERDALQQTEDPRLPFADAAFDLVFSMRTLPHLGATPHVSVARAMKLLEEVSRVLAPRGTALLQIDNPRSLWGIYHGLRHALTEHAMHQTEDGLTRFDTPRQFIRMLPPTLDPIRIYGLGVFASVWGGLQIPWLGRLFEAVEWVSRDQPLVRKFGRHLLIEARRLPTPQSERIRR